MLKNEIGKTSAPPPSSSNKGSWVRTGYLLLHPECSSGAELYADGARCLPAPDLAIEADITSKTTLEAYYALQVPEVWVYDSGKLTTKVFQDSNYIESATSLTFPNLPIAELIPKLFQQAFADGSSQMLRHLRKQITEGQFQV
jgi:hypothetical protein